MKFFIDTADTNEIKIANDMGLIDGVTTNPSLIAKSGKPFLAVIKEICEIVDGPISAEVVSLDAAGMLKEGRELAKMHKNIVVKVPLTEDGLKATKAFSKEGIRTNVTLCFSSTQALVAAKTGLPLSEALAPSAGTAAAVRALAHTGAGSSPGATAGWSAQPIETALARPPARPRYT